MRLLRVTCEISMKREEKITEQEKMKSLFSSLPTNPSEKKSEFTYFDNRSFVVMWHFWVCIH